MDNESFKIGRIRITFPPDVSDEELRLVSMIVYSYIQTVKYKTTHPAVWAGEEKVKEKKTKEQAGVS